MQEMVSEFLCFMTSEANENPVVKGHKAISSEDLISAFDNLDLAFFSPPLDVYAKSLAKTNKGVDEDHSARSILGDSLSDSSQASTAWVFLEATADPVAEANHRRPWPTSDPMRNQGPSKTMPPESVRTQPGAVGMGIAEQMLSMLPLTDAPTAGRGVDSEYSESRCSDDSSLDGSFNSSASEATVAVNPTWPSPMTEISSRFQSLPIVSPTPPSSVVHTAPQVPRLLAQPYPQGLWTAPGVMRRDADAGKRGAPSSTTLSMPMHQFKRRPNATLQTPPAGLP